MQTLLQDLRYSLRTLRKAHGYTVAVLTLALGVGANAAIFSVLRAVVIRDLPYHEPDRIAMMWTRNIRQNLPDGTSYLNFRDWKAQSRQFEAMSAYVRPEFTRKTLGGADSARIQVGLVGQGFFELLGTAPLVGRTFAPGDFTGTPRAVVISHALWGLASRAIPASSADRSCSGIPQAMRVPILRGRTLQDGDLAPGAPPVVVINEEMARRYWPGQDALGRRFKYGLDPGAQRPWKTVVGIVPDQRRQRLDDPAIPYMFQPGVIPQMDIVVRTAGDPEHWRDPIRAELRRLDPMAPPYGIVTVEQRLGRTVALRRLQTMLLLGLAAVALTLAMIGAYGVIHQSVTARTREIDVRIALGASARTVQRMVLIGGLTPAVAGLSLGLLGSLALSRTLSTFLYDTSALDPLIYASVVGVLLTVATLACLAPARRASRFDPMLALRRD